MLPGLSPLEMLHFAAQLKLPASLGSAGRLERAKAVLRQLNFSVEDMGTRIGSVDDRGLSGGQRKRVSIGAMLSPIASCLQTSGRAGCERQSGGRLVTSAARPLAERPLHSAASRLIAPAARAQSPLLPR